MPPRGYKSITVSRETYNELINLKRRWRLDSIDEVIREMIRRVKFGIR